MSNAERAHQWAALVTVLAGAVLALMRFVRYIDTVTDVDVGFQNALTWWATYVVGLGLLAIGVAGHFQANHGRETQATRDWIAFLVGLLVLVVMPAAPSGVPSFPFFQ